jgi:prepilin peptidase CpaA
MMLGDMLRPSAVGWVYLALLVAGIVTDVRDRRIPNVLVLVLLAVGVLGVVLHQAVAPSLLDALLGALAGLALWLPFWLLGLLGAGDVKFFAAASCWIGTGLAWRAALLAALLGGVMSVIVLIYQRGFQRAVRDVLLHAEHSSVILAAADTGNSEAKARTFPYALPMAIALSVAALIPRFATL